MHPKRREGIPSDYWRGWEPKLPELQFYTSKLVGGKMMVYTMEYCHGLLRALFTAIPIKALPSETSKQSIPFISSYDRKTDTTVFT